MAIGSAIASAIFGIIVGVLLILVANVMMKSLEMYRLWDFLAWCCGVEYKGPPVRYADASMPFAAALVEDLLYAPSHRLWLYALRDMQREAAKQARQDMFDGAREADVEDAENPPPPLLRPIYLDAKTAVRFDDKEVETNRRIPVEGADRMDSFVRNGVHLFATTSSPNVRGYEVSQKVGDVYVYDLGEEVTEAVASKAFRSGMQVWAADDIASVQRAIASDS